MAAKELVAVARAKWNQYKYFLLKSIIMIIMIIIIIIIIIVIVIIIYCYSNKNNDNNMIIKFLYVLFPDEYCLRKIDAYYACFYFQKCKDLYRRHHCGNEISSLFWCMFELFCVKLDEFHIVSQRVRGC